MSILAARGERSATERSVLRGPSSLESCSPHLFELCGPCGCFCVSFTPRSCLSSLIVLSLFCMVFFFYSYDYELVFGVSLKNMNKAERLTFGESLMTHAMAFTAVSEKVRPSQLPPTLFPQGDLYSPADSLSIRASFRACMSFVNSFQARPCRCVT